MTVVAELDEIINLLEAQIPANPASPKNVRKAKSLEKDMTKYFKGLEQAFPYSEIEEIYNRYIKPD